MTQLFSSLQLTSSLFPSSHLQHDSRHKEFGPRPLPSLLPSHILATSVTPGEELVEVEAGGLLQLGQLEPLAGPRLANRLLLLQYIQADLSPHTGCPLPN